MLYSLDDGKTITSIPRSRLPDYRRWCSRLTPDEYEAVVEELNRRIEGTEIQTSSWIPGADWEGTPFQPIYTKACDYDEEAAAKFFGLIVWDTFMRHPQTWSFGRYEKDGTPIQGLTYFRVNAK